MRPSFPLLHNVFYCLNIFLNYLHVKIYLFNISIKLGNEDVGIWHKRVDGVSYFWTKPHLPIGKGNGWFIGCGHIFFLFRMSKIGKKIDGERTARNGQNGRGFVREKMSIEGKRNPNQIPKMSQPNINMGGHTFMGIVQR